MKTWGRSCTRVAQMDGLRAHHRALLGIVVLAIVATLGAALGAVLSDDAGCRRFVHLQTLSLIVSSVSAVATWSGSVFA